MHSLKRAYFVFSLLAVAALAIFLTARLGYEGDTQTLVDHVFHSLACLQAGRYAGCPDTGAFAIFQYIPSALVVVLGGGRSAILHVLCYISLLSFAFSFVEMWKALRPRGEAMAGFGLLIFASGFWLRYSNLSFGEMAAAYLTLGFVSSFLRDTRLVRAAIFAFATVLTKETSAPFLLLLIVCTVFYVPESRRTPRDAVLMLVPLAAGMAVNSLFNVFRFGTWMNRGYLAPEYIVHDREVLVSNFLAAWLSPGGGIMFFWMSFSLLLVALAWIAGRLRSRRSVPAILVWFIALGLTAGFAKWYTPLGGYAWGDRLMLPWIPALAVFALWVYSAEFSELLHRLSARPVRYWAIAGLLAAASFPQYAILLRHSLIGKVMDRGFWQAWPWGIFGFYRPVPRPDLFFAALFMSSWILAIAWKIRVEARKSPAPQPTRK